MTAEKYFPVSAHFIQHFAFLMARFKFLLYISRLNKKIYYWKIREFVCNLLQRHQEPFLHYFLSTHVVNELTTYNEIEKSLFSKWVECKESIHKLSKADPILWLASDKKNKPKIFARVTT